MTEEINQLRKEVSSLSEMIQEEMSEFSSEAEFGSEIEYVDEDEPATQSDTQEACADECEDGDHDEEIAWEEEDQAALADSDGEPPEWTLELKEWDGQVYRTEVLLTTETNEGIEDKLLDEGFDKALAKFTNWYREREGLDSDWFSKFPYKIDHSSVRKRCFKDRFSEAKVFPSGDTNEVVIVTHGLYEFDANRQRNIKAHYDGVRSLAKTGTAGVGFVGLLGVLATCFGYLKMCDGSACRRRGVMRLAAIGGLVGVAALVCALAFALPNA